MTSTELADLIDTMGEILKISDRKHEAWDRAKAIIATLQGQHAAGPLPPSAAYKIRQILVGINRTESDHPDGWWETSVGAEFGAKKLAEVIEARSEAQVFADVQAGMAEICRIDAQPAAEFAWPEPEPATAADLLDGINEIERLMGRPNLSPVEQLLRDQPDLSLVEVCRRMMVIPQIGASASSEVPARGTEGYLHDEAEGPVLDRDALFEALKGIPPMPTVEQMAERYGLKLGPRLCPLPFPDGPPMTTEQVAAMARAGYTIVSHSAPPTDEQTLVAQPAAAVSDDDLYGTLEAAIVSRYVVEKRVGGGFWGYCVKAGDGSQEIFVGHKNACERVRQALQTACLDGAYMAHEEARAILALRPQAVPMTDEPPENLAGAFTYCGQSARFLATLRRASEYRYAIAWQTKDGHEHVAVIACPDHNIEQVKP